MTIHNRRHKKKILHEASILLEHNRMKSRAKLGDKILWECVDNMFSDLPLTEERIHEQKAIINWISKLGKNPLGAIKKYISSADEKTKKMAQDLANKAGQDQIGGQIKGLLKKGDWKEAFTKASGWITGQTSGNIQEISLQSIGDWWRDNPVKRIILTLSFLVIMFAQAVPSEKIDQDQVNQPSVEYSMDGESVNDINSYDKIFGDNTETPNDLKFGDQSIQNAGFETGVSFELGSSNLDTQGQQQIDDIANDYLNQIESAQANGDSVQSLDITVQGGASNTGDSWDNDNDYDGSLTENRESEAANKLKQSIKKLAQQRGMDLSGVDINYNMSGGMDVSDLGSNENVKDGQKTSTQNTLINGNLTHTPPAQGAPDAGMDLGMQDYDMAKFGGEPNQKIDDDFNPGTSRGSRNLEYRDLLYLGGITAPVTFGDYKSDGEGTGRFDWRDVDVQGDEELLNQQTQALWITNTRKAKFPILKRLQKALEGVIEIDFDGSKKYLGNVGTKYDQSTTTPITQKRNMGPRGPNKFIPDTEKGGYKVNPSLSEAKGELPPEMVKEPEIDNRIKQLQGNTTAFWKYIIEGNKNKGIVTTQVANELEKNIVQVLEQFSIMYGDKSGRGNVNFRFRKNPNYKGSKYSELPTSWNKKITGEPKNTGGAEQTGQSQEVLPFVQSYTGDYVQGATGPLVGSANTEELNEEIKRIKKLLL